MPTLIDDDYQTIVTFLGSLPRRSDPSARSQSWRTSGQLLSEVRFRETPVGESELDAALCAQFFAIDDCPIRPAYYPREDNCKRLWGHVQNVGAGPGRHALLDKIASPPRPLEADRLSGDAPTVFLSHALDDHHFAARVRLNFAVHGVRAWLAEGDLQEGGNLFEAIHAAVGRCDAFVTLLSSFSICSAWINTETLTALGKDKQMVALIDASDAPICELVRGWLADKEKKKVGRKVGDWLYSDEGVLASSAVLERYMRVASPSRVLKFRTELDITLNSLTMAECVAFYPSVPRAWKDAASLTGFDAALDHLGARALS